MKDLESCPICGKPPRWSRHNDRDHAQLSCIGTDHAVSGAWGVEGEAIRTWNRRATAQRDGPTLTEVMLCDVYEEEVDHLRALVADLFPLALVYAAEYARNHCLPDGKLHPVHQKMIDAAKAVSDEVLR